MTKKIAKKIILWTVCITLIMTAFSFVYAIDDYTVLTPLPGTTDAGGKTNLSTYLPGLFKLLIGACALAAFVMITYGGVLYMTTDAIGSKSTARGYIENAIWGLLLVLSSWIILNTINPKLLSFDLTLSTPNTSGGSGGSVTAGGNKTASGSDILTGEAFAEDLRIRQSSVLGNVKVNNPPCQPTLTSKCTNVIGLPTAMINSLKDLQKNCGCEITITGGTETSLHSAGTRHGPGNSVVDLRGVISVPGINQYIGKNPPKQGDVVTKDGLTFTYELAGTGGYSTGDHWHVTK